MFGSKQIRIVSGLLVSLAALFAGGCAGSGSSGPTRDAELAFYNAVPDSVALSFYLNEELKGAPLGYLSSSSWMTESRTEPLDVIMRETGVTVDLAAEVRSFPRDKSTASVALGLENFGDEYEKRARFVFFEADRVQPNGAKARLIVVHALNRETGFANGNVDFVSPGDNPTYALRNIPYAANRTLVVDAGTITFRVTRPRPNDVGAPFVEQTNTFEGGKIYMALITGTNLQSGAQRPQIRFIEVPPRP